MDQAAAKLQALTALWHRARGTRPIPAREDLPVAALRPWLGNLALIDLSAPAPFFRLCGTRLHARFGGEMTGRGLESLDDSQGRDALALHIDRARRTLAPVEAAHPLLPAPRGTVTYRELYLPLGADARRADMVLFASYEAR